MFLDILHYYRAVVPLRPTLLGVKMDFRKAWTRYAIVRAIGELAFQLQNTRNSIYQVEIALVGKQVGTYVASRNILIINS